MDFKTWLNFGIDQKYVSDVVCDRHEGVPLNAMEMDAEEKDDDICVPVMRVWLAENQVDQ